MIVGTVPAKSRILSSLQKIHDENKNRAQKTLQLQFEISIPISQFIEQIDSKIRDEKSTNEIDLNNINRTLYTKVSEYIYLSASRTLIIVDHTMLHKKSLKIFIFIYFILHVLIIYFILHVLIFCLRVCLYTMCMPGAFEGQIMIHQNQSYGWLEATI